MRYGDAGQKDSERTQQPGTKEIKGPRDTALLCKVNEHKEVPKD